MLVWLHDECLLLEATVWGVAQKLNVPYRRMLVFQGSLGETLHLRLNAIQNSVSCAQLHIIHSQAEIRREERFIRTSLRNTLFSWIRCIHGKTVPSCLC